VYRAIHDRFIILFESHYKRNYIHIRDVTRVFLHAIKNQDKMKGQIYNVGLSEANLSKRELCERIQKYVPGFIFQEAMIGKDPDQRNYIVSNEKIEKTGFKPTYSLDGGIKELIKGYSMLKNTRYSNI
jgi:nucleoside-diphosphate-sugar epimerase